MSKGPLSESTMWYSRKDSYKGGYRRHIRAVDYGLLEQQDSDHHYRHVRERDDSIAQDGIPQGSPLFPILYIFYNANLVEQPIHKTKGALGSADDHLAWVVEESIDENIRSLQTTIIPKAEGWARESGAIFEPPKTGLNHFTRRNEKEGHEGPELRFQGQDITASADVKLLGVTLDSKMKFQQHVATVTARATRQCLAIRRLQGSGRSKSDNCITP
jgi:hypothetical protein